MQKQKFKRPKIFPMPVEQLIDNPDFIALPAAGRGMLFTLMLYFWQTGCRPIPTSEAQLQHICRAHNATWYGHKDEILKIFLDVEPNLRHYYEVREGKHLSLQAASLAGLATRTKRKRQAQQANVSPTVSIASAIPRKELNPAIRPQSDGKIRKGLSDSKAA